MIHLRIAMLGDDRSQLFALRSCLLTAGYVAQRYEAAADFLCAVSTAGFDTLILAPALRISLSWKSLPAYDQN